MKHDETILSIVAADLKDGQFGVAVASVDLSVGKNVPFSGPFVGAIAVQGYAGPFFGIAGMKMLREGLSAEQVIASVMADDLFAYSRQILVIDAAGRTAFHSGTSLPPTVGVRQGEHYILGGCGLSGDAVAGAVAGAFESAQGDLAARLLAALQTFEAGHEGLPLGSAALRISKSEPYPYVDLRVDSHADPVAHLAELLSTWRSRQAPPPEAAADGA